MGYLPSKYDVRFVHGISFSPQYNYLVGVCIFILFTTIKTNVLLWSWYKPGSFSNLWSGYRLENFSFYHNILNGYGHLSCPVIEHFIWIDPLLRSHLSERAIFLCPKGDLLTKVWLLGFFEIINTDFHMSNAYTIRYYYDIQKVWTALVV
jgi:hypothetical protein